MQSPLVDVVIPTFDRLELTIEAVRSVQRQSLTRWRCYVIDNGSSNGVVEGLRSAFDDDRVVIVHREEQLGEVAARQLGLELGTSELVAILDSDDIWLPKKLERQVEVLGSSTSGNRVVGGVLCGYAWTTDTSVVPERGNLPAPYARGPMVSANLSTPLFVRSALERAGGFLPPDGLSVVCAETFEHYIRFSQHFGFAGVGELLVLCRTHSGPRVSSALGTMNAAEDLAGVVESYHDYLSGYPDDLARLEALVGARYLDAGDRRQGLHYLRQALRRRETRVPLLKQYGPFAVKKVVTGPRRG